MVERSLQKNKENEIYQQMELLGLKIHWFRNGDFEIPTSYNLEGFNRSEKAIVRRSLNTLIGFVNMPSIEDWFDNHHQRVIWYGQLDVSKSFDRLLNENRLRVNKWGLALWQLDEIFKVLDIRGDERRYEIFDRLEYFRSCMETEGGGKTSLEFAEEISECAYQTLWMFGRKETGNAPQDRVRLYQRN
jgi:hypothetical protein